VFLQLIFSMDNLLEFIVPLVFAAIYFFGNMLSGKSEKGDKEEPVQRGSTSQDDEAAERQRSIQESIRRKIMERRQAASQPKQVTSTAAFEPQREERRQTSESNRGPREMMKKMTPPPVRRQAEPAEAAEKEKKPSFSWDTSDNASESNIEQQLSRIEATKRKAEQIKKQGRAVGDTSQSTKRSGGFRTVRGPIRSQLRDPAAARAAFIFSEILGQPASAGKPSNVPGLSEN